MHSNACRNAKLCAVVLKKKRKSGTGYVFLAQGWQYHGQPYQNPAEILPEFYHNGSGIVPQLYLMQRTYL